MNLDLLDDFIGNLLDDFIGDLHVLVHGHGVGHGYGLVDGYVYGVGHGLRVRHDDGDDVVAPPLALIALALAHETTSLALTLAAFTAVASIMDTLKSVSPPLALIALA